MYFLFIHQDIFISDIIHLRDGFVLWLAGETAGREREGVGDARETGDGEAGVGEGEQETARRDKSPGRGDNETESTGEHDDRHGYEDHAG